MQFTWYYNSGKEQISFCIDKFNTMVQTISVSAMIQRVEQTCTKDEKGYSTNMIVLHPKVKDETCAFQLCWIRVYRDGELFLDWDGIYTCNDAANKLIEQWNTTDEGIIDACFSSASCELKCHVIGNEVRLFNNNYALQGTSDSSIKNWREAFDIK